MFLNVYPRRPGPVLTSATSSTRSRSSKILIGPQVIQPSRNSFITYMIVLATSSWGRISVYDRSVSRFPGPNGNGYGHSSFEIFPAGIRTWYMQVMSSRPWVCSTSLMAWTACRHSLGFVVKYFTHLSGVRRISRANK